MAGNHAGKNHRADAIEGKAELFIDFENRCTLFESLILCRFFRDIYTWAGNRSLPPLSGTAFRST